MQSGSRWVGWVATVALIGAACSSPPPPAPTPHAPPSTIIYILLDCLRADRILDEEAARTLSPRIAELARDGISFTNAFSASSWTRPTIPSLFTGLYPSEHGLIDTPQPGGRNDEPFAILPDEAVTLAERMKAAGYTTWMLGDQYQIAPQFGLHQGFDVYRHRLGMSGNIGRIFKRHIRQYEGENPIFAYLHYLDLHMPYCPPPWSFGRIHDGAGSTIDPCQNWRPLRDGIYRGELTLTPVDQAVLAARYDEVLISLDHEIGRVLDMLERKGLLDDAFIVLTSDHGEEFYEHESVGHGGTLYDEVVAVPLIIRPPKSWTGPRGRRVDGLVETRDLYDTLAELAEGKVPEPGSRSLLPFWDDPDREGRPYVVSEIASQVMVRTEDWKLIESPETGRYSLFSLKDDPAELHDVAAEERRTAAKLREMLAEWRASLSPLAAAKADGLDDELTEGLRALGYID